MYKSTRGLATDFKASEAIVKGIAADGGLFVPRILPVLEYEQIAAMGNLPYADRAAEIMSLFLPECSKEKVGGFTHQAYSNTNYDHPDVAPVVTIDGKNSILELWHGPTSAFKDMALQMLPKLLVWSLRETGETSEIVILVATSGDTGKAALDGFEDVEQTRVIVFYPQEGVSEIQRRQMVTQTGKNVNVVAIKGNFDDAQSGVKQIFADRLFNFDLSGKGFLLSSANSINWGRLMPQIVYYFSAYADLLKKGVIQNGQPVNFAVPTGNFGNILAGYYAKLMGLPIRKLICASNANNVLSDFIRTGIYNRKRTFYKTASPSMDILVSSNLERLLYHITKEDSQKVSRWMDDLTRAGGYEVGDTCLQAIQSVFWAGWASDGDTLPAIKRYYEEFGYLCDPHTAVAWAVTEQYRSQTGDDTHTVIASTASPFKFNRDVYRAIYGAEETGTDEFALLNRLSEKTKTVIPPRLQSLADQPVLHNLTCDRQEMGGMVRSLLGVSGAGKNNG